MRVRPRPSVGVLVFLGYLVVFYGVWIINGIDYDRIGDSATTLQKWYVAPLLYGAVFLIIAATVLRWWRAALFEVRRAPRWTLITPAVMVIIGIVALTQKDYSDTTGRMWVMLVLGSIGVGFCEEMASRGLLLVGFRGALSERQVWLWTSLLFGLLHLPNWFFGEGPGAVGQVVLAAMSGTTFYLLRRGSGTLIAAMALHGFWDFTTFVGDGGAAIGFLNVPVSIASVVLAFILTRKDRDAPTLAPYALPATQAVAS